MLQCGCRDLRRQFHGRGLGFRLEVGGGPGGVGVGSEVCSGGVGVWRHLVVGSRLSLSLSEGGLDLVGVEDGVVSVVFVEGLGHLLEEALDDGEGAVCGEIEVRVVEEGREPLGELRALVVSREAGVGQEDDGVVGLAAVEVGEDGGGLSHGVEGEEVRLSDLELVEEEVEPRAKDGVRGAPEGEAEEEDGAAVVQGEGDVVGDLAADDGEEDGAAADVAGASIVLERERRFACGELQE